MQFISTKTGAKEGFQLMVKEKNPIPLLPGLIDVMVFIQMIMAPNII